MCCMSAPRVAVLMAIFMRSSVLISAVSFLSLMMFSFCSFWSNSIHSVWGSLASVLISLIKAEPFLVNFSTEINMLHSKFTIRPPLC